MSTRSTSPPPTAKRIRLESETSPKGRRADSESSDNERTDGNATSELQCSICLQETVDQTVIPTCSHEFCFQCINLWSQQSRRCPLCSQSIGTYFIHNIRSKYDFRKHFLTPLRTSSPPPEITRLRDETARRRRTAREREREQRLQAVREESDRLHRSIARRRWIYEHGLYAKHVASNAYTRYRPFPTPAQFAASTEYISRTTIFLRRELQVWDDLDVEFLTTFVISLMKSIDIRSDSAIKLLAEFLDMDPSPTDGRRHTNAEHLAHEIYCYVRSPFRDLFVYDTVVQYDKLPPPIEEMPGRRTERRREVSEPRPSRAHSTFRSRYIQPSSPNDRANSASSFSPGRNNSSSSLRHSGSPVIACTTKHNEETDCLSPSQRSDGENVGQHNVSGHMEIPQIRGEAIRGTKPSDVYNDETLGIMDYGADLPPTRDELYLAITPQTQETGSQKKPPRTRSLVESVQAHLSGSGSVNRPRPFRRSERAKPFAHEAPARGFSGSNFTAIPALLTRLSDPVADPLLVFPQDSPAEEVMRVIRENKSLSNGIPAPEIMSQTRRRIIKDVSISNALGKGGERSTPPTDGKEPTTSHPHSQGVESPGLTQTCDRRIFVSVHRAESPTAPVLNSSSFGHLREDIVTVCHVDIDAPRSQIDGHDHPLEPSSRKAASSCASSVNRFELLARLERERSHAGGANTDPSLVESPLTDENVRASGQIAEPGIEDAEYTEAKLRRRTQLRVRLAAAKKSM